MTPSAPTQRPAGGFAAVVFDMDGVLLDTEPLYQQAMIAACRDLGYHMTPEMHAAQVGAPADTGDRMMREFMGADFPLDAYNASMHRLVDELFRAHRPVKRGARELLAALRQKRVPTAVATSTAGPLAHERLKLAELFDLFDVVVTRSDVSNGKPHPEPFLTAAARLGVEPGLCLALEDSHNGIRSAHAAGMAAVMVPDLLEATEEIAALCHDVHADLFSVHRAYFS